LRPVLPVLLRQKIQERYHSQIKYKENFIDEEFVQILCNSLNGKKFIPFPEPYETAVILTHDVEEETGFNFIPKVIELEVSLGFKSSWNIVPYKYKIDSGIINLINESGHEIGIHGYNHDGKLYYSEKIFNKRVPLINDALKKYNAVGFRSPMVHRNLRWLQKLDIKYDASYFDYDPFQPFPGGTGCIWPFVAGKFVELPYTLPQDHTLFYALKKKDITIWINKINWLVKNNGMIIVLTHPDYLIKYSHLEMYKSLLLFLKNINAWFCLPDEMQSWWKDKKQKA
ncbi:MAG TPA: hypothetical protein VGA29_05700, partial [Ignavibacteriaceae bacterium]